MGPKFRHFVLVKIISRHCQNSRNERAQNAAIWYQLVAIGIAKSTSGGWPSQRAGCRAAAVRRSGLSGPVRDPCDAEARTPAPHTAIEHVSACPQGQRGRYRPRRRWYVSQEQKLFCTPSAAHECKQALPLVWRPVLGQPVRFDHFS